MDCEAGGEAANRPTMNAMSSRFRGRFFVRGILARQRTLHLGVTVPSERDGPPSKRLPVADIIGQAKRAIAEIRTHDRRGLNDALPLLNRAVAVT